MTSTDSASGGTNLAVVLVPPIVGGVAGALLVPKHRVLGGLGGLLVGIVGSQAYVYMTKPGPAQLPQATTPQVTTTQTASPAALTPVTAPAPAAQTFETGKAYVWREHVGSGVTAQQLGELLTAVGWSSVAIRWFGPTGQGNGAGPAEWMSGADQYVASGTWTGAPMAVPAGTSARAT